MLSQVESIASRLRKALLLRPWIMFLLALVFSVSLLVVRMPVRAQTDCTNYDQCPGL